MANCTSIQKSLAWCQGTPELPGVKRRIYYIAKTDIAMFPSLPHDERGRTTSAVLQGDFVLKADCKWKYIDILPDKSQLTSEAQGELPSQTQLNKLTAVHPGVGEEASAAAAYINNTDSVFIVEDMKGNYRVLGNDKWSTKATVTQDLGQGATGTTSTTISVEATDEVPAPFYKGEIEWVDLLDTFTFTTKLITEPDPGFEVASDAAPILHLEDASIFSIYDIVSFEGIKSSNSVGVVSDEDVKATVIKIRDEKTITVQVITGKYVNGTLVCPTLPAGTKVTIIAKHAPA